MPTLSLPCSATRSRRCARSNAMWSMRPATLPSGIFASSCSNSAAIVEAQLAASASAASVRCFMAPSLAPPAMLHADRVLAVAGLLRMGLPADFALGRTGLAIDRLLGPRPIAGAADAEQHEHNGDHPHACRLGQCPAASPS